MRGIEEYKAVNISSASKEELVLMLYEAAVRHLARGLVHAERDVPHEQ